MFLNPQQVIVITHLTGPTEQKTIIIQTQHKSSSESQSHTLIGILNHLACAMHIRLVRCTDKSKNWSTYGFQGGVREKE